MLIIIIKCLYCVELLSRQVMVLREGNIMYLSICIYIDLPNCNYTNYTGCNKNKICNPYKRVGRYLYY